MSNKKCAFFGDVHGKFTALSEKLSMLSLVDSIDHVVCCGDFGYWPDINDFKEIQMPKDCVLHFCSGNHERHDLLKKFKTVTEIAERVFFVPSGESVKIGDKDVLFLGGASSIDRYKRTPGYDWFPEEVLSDGVLDKIPEDTDVIVSHTCPVEFLDRVLRGDLYEDPTRIILSKVLYKYYIKDCNFSMSGKWFFGHWHENNHFSFGNIECVCLSDLPKIGCVSVREM